MISRRSDQNRAGKTILEVFREHRCVCWRLRRGLTCHYCAHQEKDAEEYVSRQRAEAVHDLPLGDGEENSKHLPTLKQTVRSGAAGNSDRLRCSASPAPNS